MSRALLEISLAAAMVVAAVGLAWLWLDLLT
jgi:hypothetical protein